MENNNREFNDLSDTFSPTSFFINNISFRNKKRGWKNYDFVINYLLINNSSELCEFTFSELHNENIFMKGFLSDLYLRPSCYKCPSKCLKSQSDITIGDYWSIEDILPTFDDNKGVSLILINNLKAVTVFNNLNVKNVVSNYLLALKKNPVIERSVNIPVNRKKFFSKFESENIINLINICTRKTFINRIKHNALILVLFFKNSF